MTMQPINRASFGARVAAKVASGELPKDFYQQAGRKGGQTGGRPRLLTLAELRAGEPAKRIVASRDNSRKGGAPSKQRQEIQGTGAGTCACPHCTGGHA